MLHCQELPNHEGDVKMKVYPCFMIEEDSITQDEGLEWHCCSLTEYLHYKLTGEKKTRVDYYSQFVPVRGKKERWVLRVIIAILVFVSCFYLL